MNKDLQMMERNSLAVQKVFINLVHSLGLDLGAMELDDSFLRTDNVSNDTAAPSDHDPSRFRKEYSLNSGDILAVQDRFYALLKHRLQSEIQLNPPLFPWESSLAEYQDDVPAADTAVLSGLTARSLWLAQLRRLALPVALPDAVLAQLLNHCQTLANAPLREGAKLVQAVESLFPGELRALNQLAGFVMVSPARSGYVSLQERLGGDLPIDYEAALPTQQMVLSLLAAREILNSLTINVSPQQPESRYEWVTDAGVLILQTQYQVEQGVATLRINGTLPCGSRLELRAAGRRAMAECLDAGQLSVELTDLNCTQPCVLEVQLGADDTIAFTINAELA
jgi:hypothetical protein